MPDSIPPATIALQPLTAEAFAPFGDVIQTAGRDHYPINAGMVQRFHDLAEVDTLEGDGKPGISLFVARPYELPLTLAFLERHPLSSQAFVPLDDRPFIVVVAPAGGEPTLDKLRAFVTDGRQGVNYRRGVWHHVLIAVGRVQTFAVVDRIGGGANCDVFGLDGPLHCRIDLPG